MSSSIDDVEITIEPPGSYTEEVRRFLYDTYCLTDAWYPPPNDPAGFRVEGNRLLDDRDHLCHHILAWKDGKIIGCIRHSGRVNGIFETQIYDHVNGDEAYREWEIEGARLSIDPAYRRSLIGLRILIASIRRVVGLNVLGFAAAADANQLISWKSLGYVCAEGTKPFRFHDDGDKVAHLLASPNLQHQRDLMERLEKQYNQRAETKGPKL